MRRYNKYHDEEPHPLWLGILMLFIVIIVLGLSCCIRRKYGSDILHLFNQLCCKNKLNNKKSTKDLPMPNSYNWAPSYIPASSLSPKLYTSVRNVQTTSVDRELSTDLANKDEDDGSIIDEPNQQLNRNRDCETARKFYASLRNTTLSQKSSSIDSHNEPPALTPNRNKRLKSFHAPRCFLINTK